MTASKFKSRLRHCCAVVTDKEGEVTMSGPRVFDGRDWTPVVESVGHTGSQAPVPPAEHGDGTIFVSFPSFRDGERCAATLKSIFENAKNPEKVIVGLIEEASADDTLCLEAYCGQHGIKAIKKERIRQDMTKLIALPELGTCPFYNQIRLLSRYNIAAKGPADARALTRKILGNEEFCLQIDAHTAFTREWDQLAKLEWQKTGNEFAILSTAPADMKEQQEYESWTGSKSGEVPRQCMLNFLETNVPDFVSPADGKVSHLDKPLLSHSWSAAFSFSKCHVEETAPYDPFTPHVFSAEQFPRFARLWTRGYDVYTPSRNIVYHDYRKLPNSMEWFKPRFQKARMTSIERIKSFLHIDNPDTTESDLANLGIYGLGKRRSLAQLQDFVGFNLQTKTLENMKCANLEWVPYDSSISPMDNLYQDADDLDPQPEFPLRTQPTFYEPIDQPVGIQLNLGKDPIVGGGHRREQVRNSDPSNEFPVITIFALWIFGLIVWCVVFSINHSGAFDKPKRRKAKNKRSSNGVKEV